jgi:hypothetical protein
MKRSHAGGARGHGCREVSRGRRPPGFFFCRGRLLLHCRLGLRRREVAGRRERLHCALLRCLSRCQIRGAGEGARWAVGAGEGAPWAVVYVVRQSRDGYVQAGRFFMGEERQREEGRIHERNACFICQNRRGPIVRCA